MRFTPAQWRIDFFVVHISVKSQLHVYVVLQNKHSEKHKTNSSVLYHAAGICDVWSLENVILEHIRISIKNDEVFSLFYSEKRVKDICTTVKLLCNVLVLDTKIGRTFEVELSLFINRTQHQ